MAVQNQLINQHILEGQFGLEKESLRVDEGGFLSHTPHPFDDLVQIDRDFCENQIEIITGVNDSVDGVYEELRSLHNTAVERLYHLETGREYIWNCSNPPYVKSDDDIPIAKFHGHLKGKELYREYLSKKYGKKKMLYSGIHFNFSFTKKYLEQAFEKSEEKDFRAFKDHLYLNLAQNVVRFGWLIVYLTAASPLMDGSFLDYNDLGKDILSPYASGRCSEIGYWNDFVPILDYSNLASYTDSIQEYVDLGQLKAVGELYYPVRLKPLGDNSLENLKNKGVNHIELRNIDLNPLAEIGIQKEDIHFLHLLLVYLSTLEFETIADFEQVMAIKNIKEAARFNDKEILIETGWDQSENIRELTLQILRQMEIFFSQFNCKEIEKLLAYQKNKVENTKERYVKKIMYAFEEGYVTHGLHQSEAYAKKVVTDNV
jgi:glutamate--cysteine ligase